MSTSTTNQPAQETLTDLLGCKLSPLHAWILTLQEIDDNLSITGEQLFRDYSRAQQKVLDVIKRDIGKITLDVDRWYNDPSSATIDLVNMPKTTKTQPAVHTVNIKRDSLSERLEYLREAACALIGLESVFSETSCAHIGLPHSIAVIARSIDEEVSRIGKLAGMPEFDE